MTELTIFQIPLTALTLGLAAACVPPGNSVPSDAGAAATPTANIPAFRPSTDIMTAVFEDNFDRVPPPVAPTPLVSTLLAVLADSGTDARADARTDTLLEAGPDGRATVAAVDAGAPSALGPDWAQAQTSAWRIENGRLCGSNARNHGVWLKRVLPINARIEFDAYAMSDNGDLKAEVWGDGQSSATSISYTNATSYLVVLGGWKNTFHVLARINEHGADRKEIKIDKESDDALQKPVFQGQPYKFKIERTDGKTVRMSVNGQEYLSYTDPAPLAGMGHDHFGFNDWETKVCFDNVRVTPL